MNAIIFCGVAGEQLRGFVGRSIIDADNLDVFVCLNEQAFYAFGKEPLAVVDGDDDRNRFLRLAGFGPARSFDFLVFAFRLGVEAAFSG